jgi:hypothetical protein
VKTDPASVKDFLPLKIARPDQARKEVENGKYTACEVAGLSVWGDIQHARHVVGLFPKIGQFIATVMPPSSSGYLTKTGKESESHHTWWVVEQYDPLLSLSAIIQA